MQINILDARNRLSQLLKAAQAGEEVIIANRGRPVARLVALEFDAKPAEAGSPQRIADWLNSHPWPAHAQRSEKEIDATIEDARQAWD